MKMMEQRAGISGIGIMALWAPRTKRIGTKTGIDRRSMAQIMRVLLVVPGLILLAPEISRSQKDVHSSVKTFLVFPHTESPDGRYAIAWGLPKHPEVWAKVSRFCEQHPPGAQSAELPEQELKEAGDVFESVHEAERDVENYIVDLHGETIVRMLHCPHGLGVSADLHSALSMTAEYWTTPGFHPNHHDFEVLWSPRSDFVLINHTYRWDCVSFCAVSLGQTPSELDLTKRLGDAVRSFVAKSFPKGSGYSKAELDVSYSGVRQVGDNKFSADVKAQMGREWLSDDVTVNFTLGSSNTGKGLTLLDVHVGP
jgi:hypothetical protein